jgi:flagellar hook-length control protein FliK
LPLQSIAFTAKSRTPGYDAEITPAELPSGRVRFSDELGRETALVARHDRARDAGDRDEGSAERTAPPHDDGKAGRAKSGRAKPASSPASSKKEHGDDDVALALAALGIAPPPETLEKPATPPLALDGTRDPASSDAIVADVAVAGDPKTGAPLVPDFAFAPHAFGAASGDVASNPPQSSLAGELVRAAVAKTERAEPSPADGSLAPFTALLAADAGARELAHSPPPAAAHAPAAAPEIAAERAPSLDALPRVALSDVPHALPALLERLEPELRFGRRGRTWEVELRLDPPELGALRIRLEMRGDEIRGVVHCEPRVERLLGPMLKDLEENLRRHGGGAAFDLQREAKGEERPPAPRETSSGAIPRAAAEPRAPSRIAVDPSRLVDVTA